jgi:homoserine O-acetyltransferase
MMASKSPRGIKLKPREGDFTVDSHKFTDGTTLTGFNLHYATLGKPKSNESGNVGNAVLFLHGTNSSSRALLTPLFMDHLYAPGKPLDANKYFLIFPDALGHGKSTKPSTTSKAFPKYGYTDLVNLQHLLITESLGISHLHVVMGISMGGMHSWMWGFMYPDFMDGMMPIVCLPHTVQGRNLLWRRMIYEGAAYSSLFAMMLDGVPHLEKELKTPDDCIKFIDKSQRELPITRDLEYALDASRDYHPEDHLIEIKARVFALNFSDDEINPDQLGILETAMKSISNGEYLVQEDATYGHMTSAHPGLWYQHVGSFLKNLANPVERPFAVLAQCITDSEHKDSVREQLSLLGEGALSYRVHVLGTNPSAFYTLSTWSDQESLEDHITQLGDLQNLVSPPDVTRARMLSDPNPRPSRAVVDSKTQVTLIPFFTIKHGNIEAVKKSHLSVVDSTRAEPGSIDYDLYQADDPSVMFFYENWTDQKALSVHMNTPNFYRVVRGEVDPKLVVPWTGLSMSLIGRSEGRTEAVGYLQRSPCQESKTRKGGSGDASMELKGYEDYTRYLLQAKDQKCVGEMREDTDGFDEEFYSQVTRERLSSSHKDFENKTTMSGNPTTMYSTEQLVEEGGYAFDVMDIGFLGSSRFKTNPFSGKPFSSEFLKFIADNKSSDKAKNRLYPLDQAVELLFHGKGCPRFERKERGVQYFYTRRYFRSVDELPQSLPEEALKYSLNVSQPDYDKYVYRIKFKGTSNSKDDIEEFSPVYDPWRVDSDPETKEKPFGEKLESVDKAKVLRYVNSHATVRLDSLGKYNAKLDRPIKVYRGLRWDGFPSGVEFRYQDLSEVERGDKLTLKGKNPLSHGTHVSWTTNFCVAEHFSTSLDIGYGMIVSTILKPEDVLVDIRLLDLEFLFNEREVLSVQKDFEVTIEQLSFIWGSSRTDLQNWSMYRQLWD